MRNERYRVGASDTFEIFEFVSVGPKGQIPKIIKYTSVNIPNIFNLGFGDKIADSDDFDDQVVTDNKDSSKVLATVASTIVTFTDEYPLARVLAKGNTPARTRLYQIAISNNLEDISKYFKILGLKNSVWETFVKNQNYDAFLITRKWN